MSDLEQFREEVSAWLDEHCPPTRRRLREGEAPPAWGSPEFDAQIEDWKDAVCSKGWTAPTWPKEYGGAGLSDSRTRM
jgi:acyl-CoA dehydrogenase